MKQLQMVVEEILGLDLSEGSGWDLLVISGSLLYYLFILVLFFDIYFNWIRI